MEILFHLSNIGYDIYVLSTGEKEDIAKLNALGFKTIDIGSVVVNPLKAILFFYRLIRAMHGIHPKMIFSFTIRPNIFGSIVARILKIPIVSNVTGTGPLIEDQSILYKLIRGLYKFSFKKNQRVFFQNEDDFLYFVDKKFVTLSQAKLLPGSGVDTEYYIPIKKDVEISPFTFLMISRLIRDKGILDYIQAAETIKNTFPNIKFQLLGPFWTQSISKNTITKEEVDTWVKKGIVDYLGYTLDVRPFIAQADCIVLPSYREGCANVLMQGASMEKPLIASNVTGCKNLIENQKTGLVCEVKNPKDLADKMEQMYLLTPLERENMGKAGRTKMQNEYQKSIVLKAYEDELNIGLT